MDVTTAVKRIKRQFGDEFDVVINDDDIYGWIYDAESDIIRTTGCNDTTISVPSTSFPTDVPATVNIKRLTLNGKALQYVTVEELDLLNVSLSDKSTPQYWYKAKFSIEGAKVCLYPLATDTVNVNISYNKVPTIMSGATSANTFTVPDIYHEDIVKYCIGRAHNKNNNLQAEAAQMQIYDRNLNIRRDEAQTGDTVLYKAGDPMDFDGVYS